MIWCLIASVKKKQNLIYGKKSLELWEKIYYIANNILLISFQQQQVK